LDSACSTQKSPTKAHPFFKHARPVDLEAVHAAAPKAPQWLDAVYAKQLALSLNSLM